MKRNRLVKLLSKNSWWDWRFLTELELEKLKQMLHGFEGPNTHLMNADDVVRDLKLAIYLLSNVIKDNKAQDYVCDKTEENVFRKYKFIPNRYINIRNSKRFLPLVDFNKEGLSEDIINLYKCTLYEQKCWYLYNKLRAYKMRNWWD